MKSIRIIPCLDVSDGRVVKGTNFVNLVDAGDPVELAAQYDLEGADELVFLDITASSDNRDTVYELVRRCAEKVFIPFTIGGGIRTVSDARKLLREGAEKVSVNTAAVNRPELISEIASEFGNQCVVLAIDARKNTEGVAQPTKSGYGVYINGGRTPTQLDAVEMGVPAADERARGTEHRRREDRTWQPPRRERRGAPKAGGCAGGAAAAAAVRQSVSLAHRLPRRVDHSVARLVP